MKQAYKTLIEELLQQYHTKAKICSKHQRLPMPFARYQ